jgi:hypothetical protein
MDVPHPQGFKVRASGQQLPYRLTPSRTPLRCIRWGSSCEQIQFKVIAKHGALTLEEVLAGRACDDLVSMCDVFVP